VAIALSLTFSAFGQASKKSDEKGKKAQAPAPLRELFIELDANGDRVIDREEVPESGRKSFDTLLKYGDADHDGKLEASEYRNLLLKVNPARVATPEQRERRFKTLDRNEDGKLGPDEFQGGPARFKQLDRNGDAFLSRDEIPWLDPAKEKKAAGKRPKA
jgi:Ca2+-binding EF-hand superfamily protein